MDVEPGTPAGARPCVRAVVMRRCALASAWHVQRRRSALSPEGPPQGAVCEAPAAGSGGSAGEILRQDPATREQDLARDGE